MYNARNNILLGEGPWRISAMRTVHKEKEESLGGTVLLAVMGISLGYQAKSTRYLIIYFYPFPCGFWMLSLILEFPE